MEIWGYGDSAMFSSTFCSRNNLGLFWGKRQENNLMAQELWRNLSKLEDYRWQPESWPVCGFSAAHSKLPLTTFCNVLKASSYIIDMMTTFCNGLKDSSYIIHLMLCYLIIPMNWNPVLWKIQLACFQKNIRLAVIE